MGRQLPDHCLKFVLLGVVELAEKVEAGPTLHFIHGSCESIERFGHRRRVGNDRGKHCTAGALYRENHLERVSRDGQSESDALRFGREQRAREYDQDIGLQRQAADRGFELGPALLTDRC